MKDTTIPDLDWWFSDYADFEHFVGIGAERTQKLAAGLREEGVSEFIINRLLKANGLPHGPCNKKEEVFVLNDGPDKGKEFNGYYW